MIDELLRSGQCFFRKSGLKKVFGSRTAKDYWIQKIILKLSFTFLGGFLRGKSSEY